MEENSTDIIIGSIFIISVISFIYFKFIKNFLNKKYK